MSSTAPPANGFRSLETALVRRRLQAIDTILRLEILAIAALSTGFVFWQVRVPLDSLARKDGPLLVLVTVGITWLVLALLAAALAGGRMARDLRRGPEGPPWLTLPIAPETISRHLAWNARVRALPLAVPAAGLLLASIGLAPWWWLLLLAAAFVLIVTPATRLGCWVAVQLASRTARGPRALHPILRLLARHEIRRHARALAPARWRGGSSLLAMCRKDLLVSLRPTHARRLAVVPVVFVALAAAAWALPTELALARFLAFGLSLIAAAALAQWLVALAGTDPFNVIRVLPVGLKEVWGARVLWALIGAAVLVAVHAVAAPALSPVAYRLFLGWTGLAAFCIALLGANYGVTLFPRSDVAGRMLMLTFGLAMAASLMIPLLGWVLLLTAVLHSSRRLPRWQRLEDL
jgi:hypothetical protein